MKTFCGRWTDRTTKGNIVEELWQREFGGWVGVVRLHDLYTSCIWSVTGLAWTAEIGDLIPIPPAPVVRPWESRAEMFKVCGATPWFKRKTARVDMHPPAFSDATGIYFNGPGMIRWNELADKWLWYPHYGSDEGRPCVIEIQQTERTER